MTPTLIYCASGNPRFAAIAVEAGFRYGAQLPGTCAYPPYFADQDWKKPNRAAYMTALAHHRPYMATVLDWEHEEQLDEVLDWAEEAAHQVTGAVLIIPKVIDGIERLPCQIGGKPVVLGYSVPSRFGATPCVPWEFEGRQVHLLGGSPHRQMREYELLTATGASVVSADGNMSNKMATRFCRAWIAGKWMPVRDGDGALLEKDAPEAAFRMSCINIFAAWKGTRN